MRFYFLALKRWWEYRLRYWLNRRVLRKHSDAIAMRMAKFGIDVKSSNIENAMDRLECCEEQEKAAQATADLFADPQERPDPFGRFNGRHKPTNPAELADYLKEEAGVNS